MLLLVVKYTKPTWRDHISWSCLTLLLVPAVGFCYKINKNPWPSRVSLTRSEPNLKTHLWMVRTRPTGSKLTGNLNVSIWTPSAIMQLEVTWSKSWTWSGHWQQLEIRLSRSFQLPDPISDKALRTPRDRSGSGICRSEMCPAVAFCSTKWKFGICKCS